MLGRDLDGFLLQEQPKQAAKHASAHKNTARDFSSTVKIQPLLQQPCPPAEDLSQYKSKPLHYKALLLSNGAFPFLELVTSFH